MRHDGDSLVVDVEVDPGGAAPDHLHPSLTERWEVLEGEATFTVAGKSRTAQAGEQLTVAPGVRHAFANRSDSLVKLRATVTPAQDTQGFLTDSAAMHQAGKLTRLGRPTSFAALLEAAAFGQRYRDTIILYGPTLLPPPAVQRLLFPPLARLKERRERTAARTGAQRPMSASASLTLTHRATDVAGTGTAIVGAALVLDPVRSATILGLNPGARRARTIGLADLALVPGLLRGRPRWPWMAARAALNMLIAAQYHAEARSRRDDRRQRRGATAMIALTVFDGGVAATLYAARC